MIKTGKLKDVEDVKEFEQPPVGEYHVQIVKAESVDSAIDEKTGKTKFPKLKVQFKVLDTVPSAEGEEFKGKNGFVFKDYILTDKAMPFLKPLLVALGYAVDEELEINEENLINEQLVINIQHKKQANSNKIWAEPKVDGYKSLVSLGIEPIVADEEVPF